MPSYFLQFMAYTLAMVGFLGLCVFIYKKLCLGTISHTNPDYLCIENGLRINARKQIFVVRAGKERFLIASDTERTTMLAKLEEDAVIETRVKEDSKVTEQQPVFLKKAAKKHLGNVKQVLSSDIDESTPIMKRISQKMKAL